MMTRTRLSQAKRWVVKIGSSLVTAKGQGLDHAAIADRPQPLHQFQVSR